MGYPPEYERMGDELGSIAEAAKARRQDLQSLAERVTDPRDARQIGQAIALMAVAERAADDACSTIGRTSLTMWQSG